MKKVSKIVIFLFLIIIMLVPNMALAREESDTENETYTNPDLLIPGSVKREREEEKQKQLEEESTNYDIFSEEDKIKFKNFIQVEDKDKKFLAIEGIALLIILIMVIKTKAIELSTKSSIIIAVLAIAAYIFRTMITGNIIYMLDIFLQFLGVILIVMSYFFIYKHDNLLMYVPICVIGIWYSIKNLSMVRDNILCQMFLIAAPIVLYILGAVMNKTKELELLIPVKEKHERKKDETHQ